MCCVASGKPLSSLSSVSPSEHKDKVALCSAVGLASEAMADPSSSSPARDFPGEEEVTEATEPRGHCLEQEGLE